METLTFSSLLSYGAIGLGCILAVLAYFLLRNEQQQATPRQAILTSVYVYMAFSLVLAAFGFGAELWKAKVADLRAEVDKRDKTIAEFQQKDRKSEQELAQVNQNLVRIRSKLEGLMHGKSELVQLLERDNVIRAKLESIDKDIESLIKE